MTDGMFQAAAEWHAVVTGANKGIGLEICRPLASRGVTVVLTSRDEKRGLEAVCKLKEEGSAAPSGEVIFHQLDVTDSTSIDSLVEFVSTRFRKLDILVNNAVIGGIIIDFQALTSAVERVGGWPTDEEEWKTMSTQTYKLAVECLETNYFGAKRVTEALLPLLQQSSSARIVNVSSDLGLLQNIPGESINDALGDIENLTGNRIEEILKKFLEDFQQGQLAAKGWPETISAYKLSKVALNAYTRLLAKEFPTFLVNSVCSGFVEIDITSNNGLLSAPEGAEGPVHLALLPETGPSGLCFFRKEVCSF
ncbi:(+)-neomenthol dehydrogenase-like isoform X2 [Punica granatum]|uniref:(+)-neomenthol dehydrogenase-like isoform X2 n=1 Tax=Punica granatum TaxID=22663 RepID=A0A6P8C4A2_PUNGR|nr:(+)-neomenthol dehydrogenase-like isoform X2 [Punica granatum]